MQDRLERRLAELRHEYQLGEAKVRELESQRALLSDTMLRISGAIQVLEEALEDAQPASAGRVAEDLVPQAISLDAVGQSRPS